jgi:peptide deformylase
VIRDIYTLGQPILRQETTPVVKVTDELRRLIDDMFETMYAARGVGLAAPQVGREERLAVIDTDDSPIVIINPEIIAEEGMMRGEEGCLSIPEVFGDVERAAKVTVRALDRDGNPFDVTGTELFARALQHEIDHLHGKLFLDHLGFIKRRNALAKWESMKKDFPGMLRRVSQETPEPEEGAR